MKKLCTIFLVIILFIKLSAQRPVVNIELFFKKGVLSVSEDGKYLKKFDKPFLYSAFTMWNFLYNYNLNQSLRLLEIIKSKGFNVFQFSILPVNQPIVNRNPFLQGNVTNPDSMFFYFLDTIINFAREKDLILAISLYWNTGEKIIENKFIKNKISISHAFKYGQWIAQRYQNIPNIIWIVGGNAIINDETYPIWEAMGSGIRSVDKEHLITFLGTSGQSSIRYNNSSWLNFNSLNYGKNYLEFNKIESLILDNQKQKILKPIVILNLPCENDTFFKNNETKHLLSYKDVIKYNLWSFFIGASSINYCVCNDTTIFDFLINNKTIDSLFLFIKSRPWYTKAYKKNVIKNLNYLKENSPTSIVGEGFLMVYLPEGGEIDIDFRKAKFLNDNIVIYWYNLSEGKIVKNDTLNYRRIKNKKFVSPSKEEDYILLIDELKRDFPFPGKIEFDTTLIDKPANRRKNIEKKPPI